MTDWVDQARRATDNARAYIREQGARSPVRDRHRKAISELAKAVDLLAKEVGLLRERIPHEGGEDG